MWRFNHKSRSMPAGKTLRVEVLEPALLHWSGDDWQTIQDVPTRDTGLGLHVADLATAALPPGGNIRFTLRWENVGTWEGNDYQLHIESHERE
jgi:glucoamylase